MFPPSAGASLTLATLSTSLECVPPDRRDRGHNHPVTEDKPRGVFHFGESGPHPLAPYALRAGEAN
ncbi:MAG: hypothetical protein ACO4AJ_02920, partial [Prochlorothrix sp.]